MEEELKKLIEEIESTFKDDVTEKRILMFKLLKQRDQCLFYMTTVGDNGKNPHSEEILGALKFSVHAIDKFLERLI